MSNLDNIIADIKEVNHTHDFWIRDKNGDIKDDVICGDVIPFLEELKEYEVDISQEEIKDVLDFWDNNLRYNVEYWADNTYNSNSNIDHDIDYRIAKSNNDRIWFIFMVHRYGDVRGNYTDYAVCEFDYVEEIFELDSVMQCKFFGEHYVADINIFSEMYNVYDTETCEDVGWFYDVEVADVLKSINEIQKGN